jgi:hypothetical protein
MNKKIKCILATIAMLTALTTTVFADTTSTVAEQIQSVATTNGTLTISLAAKPTITPQASDFTATDCLNGGTSSNLSLSNFNYDGNQTVTFSFVAIAQTTSDQKLDVSAEVTGGTPVAAQEISIPSSATTPTDTTISRQQFYDYYMDEMMKIVDLRTKTAQQEAANHKLEQQIKEQLKALDQTNNAAIIAQIQKLRDTNKDLNVQLKNSQQSTKDLNTQLRNLRKQFQDAIKLKDTSQMANIESQIKTIEAEINSSSTSQSGQAGTIKQQISDNKAQIQTLSAQLKAAKQTQQENMSTVKPLEDQLKTLNQQIISDTKAKDQVWITYAQDVKAKNYASAENDLQTIATDKTNILGELGQKNTLLNQIVTELTKLSTTTTQQ